MTSQTDTYNDIQEGKPRITSYEDNGVRTTKTTTKLGPDPTEKPKETVSVRKIEHPDSTETITVTEKKLPPIRYTETITREKLPKKVTTGPVQVIRPTLTNGPATEVLNSINIPPTAADSYVTTEIPPNAKTYNIVRRERIVEDPNAMIYPSTRQDRIIVRQTPDPTTIIREPTSYIQMPNSRTTRILEVRQPPSPVIVDVATPPLTTTRKTTIINDTANETLIDDRRTLVNYQDDSYYTRRIGRRSDWCGGCGADCFNNCNCFDDCCGERNCCRSFARRKDVASYRTRTLRDGRRVRYRNADVPGYRCCNCCTGWLSSICPCCSCLEWFCACPCWLWLCCLLPLLLGLLGLSIGLLTQLPSITNKNNNNNVQTLRVIEEVVNETWYIYGLDQPCAGSATTFPPSLSTITTLIPCAETTTSWARIIQATTLITISKTINSNSNNQYNELRVTQSYNTVIAVLGQNAVCQPDRNLPGTPLYCDQTTTSFSVTATSSSSTVFAVQVSGSDHLDLNYVFLFILLFLSFIIQQYFQLIIRSIFIHVI